MKKPYSDAIKTGLYAKPTGLLGKYDNVRRYWEDGITRLFLRPYLVKLIEQRGFLRILDLGCGSGDGYELLTSIMTPDRQITESQVDLVTMEKISLYKGIDINADLIAQAESIYGGRESMTFKVGDFTNGLPLENAESPYDIYFTSYGTLSHLRDSQLAKLLSDIAEHSNPGSLVICDFLGRYSYEWQDLWRKNPRVDDFIDYRISYLYTPEEREHIKSFPLRLVGRNEFTDVIERVNRKSTKKLETKRIFDRSILVGRHMETAEYNTNAQPIRRVINSLHEEHLRTDLSELYFQYYPRKGFTKLNRFFRSIEECWNTLVRFCQMRLAQRIDPVEFEGWRDFPPVLQQAIMTLDRVIDSVVWMRMGDPRANIIEPQLGYALRGLEMELQQGIGCAHSLVGIFEVKR